jgi:hypothetical protein
MGQLLSPVSILYRDYRLIKGDYRNLLAFAKKGGRESNPGGTGKEG